MKYDCFILDKGSKLYVAFFDENFDLDLKKIPLSSHDVEKLSKITAINRRKEMLFVRGLLAEVLPCEEIAYSEVGAPCLLSHNHCISISHSQKCVALMVAEGKCGVDVELLDRDYSRVKKRLLTSKDIELKNSYSLAAAWVAKESLFKTFSDSQIDIFLDITILYIDDTKVECMVKDQKLSVQILNHKGHLMAGVENF